MRNQAYSFLIKTGIPANEFDESISHTGFRTMHTIADRDSRIRRLLIHREQPIQCQFLPDPVLGSLVLFVPKQPGTLETAQDRVAERISYGLSKSAGKVILLDAVALEYSPEQLEPNYFDEILPAYAAHADIPVQPNGDMPFMPAERLETMIRYA